MHKKVYEEAKKIVDVIRTIGSLNPQNNSTKENRRRTNNCLQKLQLLQIISPTLMLREEKSGISLAGLTACTGAELAKKLEEHWVNPEMEEKSCDSSETYLKTKVNIGTEFTFHHADFQYTLKDLENNARNRGIERGKEVLALWTQNILTRFGKEKTCGIYTIKAQKSDEAPQKKFEAADYEAYKIDFYIKKKEQNAFAEKWSVNFDLDPSCIELQTEPKPYRFFEDYQGEIEMLLFSSARPFGLVADKSRETGGGGHICLDAPSAFSDNAVYLRNFLVLYACETKREMEKDAFQNPLLRSFLTAEQRALLTASKDKANAPFLSEIKEWNLFKGFINSFDAAPTDIARFVNGIHSNVYKNMADELAEALGEDADAGDRYHYQAVNLEHLPTPAGMSRRSEERVELRRFDAQESIGELLAQLDALLEILKMARTNWKIAMEKALESEYFAG